LHGELLYNLFNLLAENPFFLFLVRHLHDRLIAWPQPHPQFPAMANQGMYVDTHKQNYRFAEAAAVINATSTSREVRPEVLPKPEMRPTLAKHNLPVSN
jgi:hypothetical protein